MGTGTAIVSASSRHAQRLGSNRWVVCGAGVSVVRSSGATPSVGTRMEGTRCHIEPESVIPTPGDSSDHPRRSGDPAPPRSRVDSRGTFHCDLAPRGRPDKTAAVARSDAVSVSVEWNDTVSNRPRHIGASGLQRAHCCFTACFSTSGSPTSATAATRNTASCSVPLKKKNPIAAVVALLISPMPHRTRGISSTLIAGTNCSSVCHHITVLIFDGTVCHKQGGLSSCLSLGPAHGRLARTIRRRPLVRPSFIQLIQVLTELRIPPSATAG